MGRVIAGVIGATLGAFIVWILSGNTFAAIIGGVIGMIVPALYRIERLHTTNTAQQTQIDDLKRELEEVKRKLNE